MSSDIWVLIRNAFCALSILLTIISIVYHIKSKKDKFVFLSIFYLVAISLTMVIFCFTDMNFTCRYFFPILIYSFLLIVNMLVNIDKPYLVKSVIVFAYLSLTILSSFNIYKVYKYHDITKELREAIVFLSDNNYYNGYATGYYADPITELTNGEIEVWKWWQGDTDNQYNINSLMDFAQKKSHETNKPTNKVFILLDKGEYNIIPFKDRINEMCIYESENYMIFGFDNYESCEAICGMDF